MDEERTSGWFDRLRARTEAVIMTRLVPKDNPGPVFRVIFKIPLLLYRAGLGNFVGSNFLLLTTSGRKSGKPHATPLEFGVDKKSGAYIVSAGWGGKTDWYKNALANPRVTVQIGQKVFEAEAIPVPHREVAEQMLEIARRTPAMVAVWQRWSDRPLDETLSSMMYAAQFFPSLKLIAMKNGDR